MARAVKQTKGLTATQLANKVKTSTVAVGEDAVMFPDATDLLTAGNAKIAALLAADAEVNSTAALLRLAHDKRETKWKELDKWYGEEFIPYVADVAKGASDIFLAAMLALAKPPGPAAVMPKVTNLVFAPGGDDGTGHLRFKSVRGARVFEVQTSSNPMDPATWQTYDILSASALDLTGLPSTAKCWVRVRAIGAGNNKGPWSDPACCTIP